MATEFARSGPHDCRRRLLEAHGRRRVAASLTASVTDTGAGHRLAAPGVHSHAWRRTRLENTAASGAQLDPLRVSLGHVRGRENLSGGRAGEPVGPSLEDCCSSSVFRCALAGDLRPRALIGVRGCAPAPCGLRSRRRELGPAPCRWGMPRPAQARQPGRVGKGYTQSTGPLHRSCEATSRRAPLGRASSGDLTDSFSLQRRKSRPPIEQRTPGRAICSRERALSHARPTSSTLVPLLPGTDGPPGRRVLALRRPVGV